MARKLQFQKPWVSVRSLGLRDGLPGQIRTLRPFMLSSKMSKNYV